MDRVVTTANGHSMGVIYLLTGMILQVSLHFLFVFVGNLQNHHFFCKNNLSNFEALFLPWNQKNNYPPGNWTYRYDIYVYTYIYIYNYIHLKKSLLFESGDFFVCFPHRAFQQPKNMGFENHQPAKTPGILGLVGAGNFADLDRAWTAAVGVEILTLFIFSISTEAKREECCCLRKMSIPASSSSGAVSF